MSAAIGQTRDFDFQHLSLEQGLSQALNSFVYHDSRGFIWVSSLDGLNRFDGRSVKVYRPIANNIVSMRGSNQQGPFFEAPNGDLWFCTTEAINCYRRHTDDFESFQLKDLAGKYFKEGYYAFHLEADGKLWVRLNNQLYLFDINTHQYALKGALQGLWCAVDTTARGKVSGVYSWFFNVRAGIQFRPVLADNTLGPATSFFAEKENTGLPPLFVSDIWIQNDNFIWLCSNKGLIKVNRHTHHFKPFVAPGKPGFAAMARVDDHTVALSTSNNGIWFFDTVDKAFTQSITAETGNPRTLTSVECEQLYKDSEENFWVSHWNNGLSYTNFLKKKTTNIRLDHVFPKLAGSSVELSGLVEDNQCRIWCSTEGSGVYLFYLDGKPCADFSHRRDLPYPNFTHLLKDHTGAVWLVERHHLYRYAAAQDRFEEIHSTYNVPELLFAYETKQNSRILVGTYSGIYEIVTSRAGKRTIIPAAGFEAYKDDLVDWIYEDNNGTVYLGRNASTLTILKKGLTAKDFSFGYAKAAYESPDGNTIWLATMAGLVKMNKNSLQPNLRDESNGLPNQYLYSVVPDSTGNLWISCNRGVLRYSMARDSVRQYGRSDGFWADEFFSNVWLRSSKGDIWLGNRDVLNVFHPEAIRDVPTLPKIQITDLKVNDLDWKGDTYIGECENLSFEYTRNTLSFSFVALEYSAASNNRMWYKLENYDKDWLEIPLGSPGFARYAKLPPGRYIFKIKAANSDGVCNSDFPGLIIVIEPPIWQRWWFILLAFCLLAAAGYALYRYRLARIRKELGFQQRMTESEMKALRAQMNPHFIFNSLNSINAYILRNLPVQASAYLTKFAELMRQILDNSTQETIPLEEEIQFIQSYLQAESMRLEQKLTFEISVDDSVDTYLTRIPSMVLQPYLENAIWHGIAPQPEGGKIAVSIRRVGEALILLIEDNGIGRAKAQQLRAARPQQHESKGMHITQERLTLFDQKYGAHTNLTTIDLYDNEGIAIGTRIEIKIA